MAGGLLKKFELAGKKAVVVGGATNIGKRVALGLAEAGADIAVVDINNDEAEKTVEKIKDFNRKAISVKTDISILEDVKKMVDKVVNEFQRIDILVNCAAIFGTMDPLLELDEKDWDRMMSINLKGTFLCCKEIGKVMADKKNGKIINFASINGILASRREHMSDYNIAKAGVIQLTRCFAAELGKYGINVNSISPGYHRTDSDITELSEESREELLNYIPIKRLAVADDMKPVVLFLASDASNNITGHNLLSDGGRLCWFS